MVSGKTSAAQRGSMPVAWKEDRPWVQAVSSFSTTRRPRLSGYMSPVTAVDTTFLPDASSRQMSSSAAIGFISPCGM
jgi:hypothetical protein